MYNASFGRIAFIFSLALTLSGCHFPSSKSKHELVKQSLGDMTFIKGGNYMMGATIPELEAGNMIPNHKVYLSNFYISRYNVSYKKYDLFTQAIGRDYFQSEAKELHVFDRAPNYPVHGLTWYQANEYCQYLGKQTGLAYFLPTEAQWEYVARNGGKKNWIFPTNDGTQKLGRNFPSFSQLSNQKNSFGTPGALPVGSIPCTPMHICGITGEVNQWLKDWYSSSYYSYSPINNPQGPAAGELKVIRGEGAGGDHEFAHVFGRAGIDPKKQWAGFRCVINTEMPPEKFKAYIKKFEKQS